MISLIYCNVVKHASLTLICEFTAELIKKKSKKTN